MNEESKNLQKNIDDLENIIGDPILCTKIRNATETVLPEGEKIGGKFFYLFIYFILEKKKIKVRLLKKKY